MWLYGAHSDNAELILFLEENKIKPRNEKYYKNYNYYDDEQFVTYESIYEESIKCHHNAIADYIKDNFLNQYSII